MREFGLAPPEEPGAFPLTSGRGGAVYVDPRGGRMTPLSTPFVAAARWEPRDADRAAGRGRRVTLLHARVTVRRHLDGRRAGLIVDVYVRHTGTGERLPERRPY